MDLFDELLKSLGNITIEEIYNNVIEGKVEEINIQELRQKRKLVKIDGSTLELPINIEKYILSLSLCIFLFGYICGKEELLFDVKVSELFEEIRPNTDGGKQTFISVFRDKFLSFRSALCLDAAFLYYYEALQSKATDKNELLNVTIKEYQIESYFNEINFYYLDLSSSRNREKFLEAAKDKLYNSHLNGSFIKKILPAFLITLMLSYTKDTEKNEISVEDKYLTLLSRHFDVKSAKSDFAIRLKNAFKISDKSEDKNSCYLKSLNSQYSFLTDARVGNQGLEAANLKFLSKVIEDCINGGCKQISKSMSYFFLNQTMSWFDPLFRMDGSYNDLLEVVGWKTRLELGEFIDLRNVGDTITNAYSWLSANLGNMKAEALSARNLRLNVNFINQSDDVLLPILPYSFVKGLNYLIDQIKKVYWHYGIEEYSLVEVEKVYDCIIADWENNNFSQITKNQVFNYWLRKYCIETSDSDQANEDEEKADSDGEKDEKGKKDEKFEKDETVVKDNVLIMIGQIRQDIINKRGLDEIARALYEGTRTIRPFYLLLKDNPDLDDEEIYNKWHEEIFLNLTNLKI